MTKGERIEEQLAPRQCKYCQSKHIIKYGHYKCVQRYFCKDCHRKFISADTEPKMWYSKFNTFNAINMYYEGMSFPEIQRTFIKNDNNYISRVSIYNWVKRKTIEGTQKLDDYHPQVSDEWVAVETVVQLRSKKIWLWDILDTKTRFLLVSHLVDHPTFRDTQVLLEEACRRANKCPRIIYTDKLKAYLEGIESPHVAETTKNRPRSVNIVNNVELTECFHSYLEGRTQAMRNLKSTKSAEIFIHGWLLHYNFFRPRTTSNESTPAELSGIMIQTLANEQMVKT